MMSAAQPYVILHYDRYNILTQKASKRESSPPPPAPSKPSPPPSPILEHSDQEMSPEADNSIEMQEIVDAGAKAEDKPVSVESQNHPSKISDETKDLIVKKKLHSKAFEKFLKAILVYKDEAETFENLEILIERAMSQKKKEIYNEPEFYAFLTKHQLLSLVKNRYRLKKYWPLWYKVID